MKALVVKGSLSAEELSKIAKVEKDVRLNRRLQALSLIKRGWRIGDVSTPMLVSKRTIENWSKKLEISENITLFPLPPYSPELNPMELGWKYLREHYLSNRLYKDYAELLDVGCMAWNELTDDINLIKSLCHVEWASYENTSWNWYNTNSR